MGSKARRWRFSINMRRVAVSSASMSLLMSAGIWAMPAWVAAVHRRFPAMIWYGVGPSGVGRTRTLCKTPFAAMFSTKALQSGELAGSMRVFRQLTWQLAVGM